MKKTLLVITALTSGYINTYAQAVPDSTSMGTGYANQVFYSLTTGTVRTQANNDWDLAFGSTGQSSAILFNAATGNKLYAIPGKTPVDFATCDSVGHKGFPLQYNSDTTWNEGALNQGSTSPTDLGWGEYDMVTHTVAGTKVYMVKYSSGSVKKFYIKDLTSGVYSVVIANIDGSSEQTVTITKANFNTKNFAYLSLTTGTTIDREPVSADWDILFTRYITSAPGSGPGPYNGVSGVLNNKGVTVAEARKVNKVTATHTGRNFVTAINEIGYDWKAFNGAGFTPADSLCYFIKTKNSKLYKVIFTGFGGSATGKSFFTKQEIVTTSVADNAGKAIASIGLFPNPAKENSTLVLNNETIASTATVAVFDITGKLVDSNIINVSAGLNQHTINIAEYSTGLYFVQVQLGNNKLTSKLTVVK